GINTCKTDCTDAEWIEYCNMPQIHDNKTSSEKNNLLLNESKKYLETRRLIRLLNSGSYASEIGIAICFSCNHNKYCGVSYNEYLLKVKKKSILGYDYDNEYALHRYRLWMQNAIKKIERARKIEYFYRSDGLCATELAQHYQLLWVVREEM
ncbi:34834_t:CDS:2, partial [Gigaspora margarita]